MILFRLRSSLLFLMLSLSLAQGQNEADQSRDELCASASTCSECISASPNCTWCSDELVSGDRCRLFSSWGSSCRNLSDPHSEIQIERNDDIKTEQVAPQSYNIFLRPGEKASVRVTVRPAENFPVDLYYLMDMSNSMKDDLENLKKLAGDLANALKERTSNTRVGFGTFVDKTTTPYVDLETFSNPCGVQSCASPYSFKNGLPLTDDVQRFVDQVQAEEISGNVDFPEGGMDALMQVIVCGTAVGWDAKPRARRIIVLASDAGFHFAGDGKLGGAVIPNDGLCHLNSSGQYTEAINQDYPSIGHLNEKLKESSILPVFAIQAQYVSQYRKLEGQIDAVRVAALDVDSGNVVKLIGDIYDEIVSTVSPVIPVLPGVSIVATPNCNSNVAQTKAGECQGVQLGQNVTFDFEISADSCSFIESNPNIRIRFPGFNDIDIKLTPICECGCANQSVANVSLCRGGILRCGLCECEAGKYGERCECNRDDENIASGCDAGTTNSSSADFVPCNGPSNGDCVCGKCRCRENFVGDQCQCNQQACSNDGQGNLCGGSDRGRCACTTDSTNALIPKCVCNSGYSGEACDCDLSVDNCKENSFDEKVCSGHGTCVCGQCNCNAGYIGRLCSTCTADECFDFCTVESPCIECVISGTPCSPDCSQTNVTLISPLTTNASATFSINGMKAEACFVIASGTNSDCKVKFYYTFNPDGSVRKEEIVAESDLACDSTEKFAYLPLVLGLVLGLLALVLIPLLLWKLITMYLDNLEYKKFVQEQQSAKYQKGVNPLYKNPEQKTANPAYGKA